jgi:hypothetical protein
MALQPPQWVMAPSLSRLHDHTQALHTRQDSSGEVISPSQRPLPDNTQHSQQTDIRTPGGIRTHNPSKRAAADRAATEASFPALCFTKYSHFHFPSQYSDSLRLLPSCNVNTLYCFLFVVKVQTLCKKMFLYPPLRIEDHRLSVF